VADVGIADLAHAVAAIEAGVVPREAGAELVAGLLELQAGPNDFLLDPALGDVYTNREAWLSAHTRVAGWLGVGRARREAVTTGYTLLARERVLALVSALANAGDAFARVAEGHRRSLMPDYTYLQAGQPTSFGHYLLGFAYALLRDLERARELFARLDRCPAGCGSTNGSTLPLGRERLAELLGFPALVAHARDAMWQADGPVEALAVACAAAVNLDRLAEDLAIFSTAEFGFVTLADEHSRASKAMPQKKNPFALSYVRAVANRAIGVQAGLAAAGRTPSGQMDNRFAAYGDVPKSLAEVTGAADLMAAVVGGLEFDAAAAAAILDASFAFASDLAELVMREGGLDYRTAHALVGVVARGAMRLGTPSGGRAAMLARERPNFEATPTLDAMPTLEAIDAAARAMLGRPLRLSPVDLFAALDPSLALERRRGPGGAAPDSVAAMIADVREKLAETALWHARTSERLAGARERLFACARRIAGQAMTSGESQASS
jgi:argininosuccinate lyase